MKLESYHYTENFCEENIWHLCQHPSLEAYSKKVLIISNGVRNCPFWHQKSSKEGQPVRWDYHVILLASLNENQLIYDFDSALDLPSSLTSYLQQTFRPDLPDWERDKPQFKAIPSVDYVSHFTSPATDLIQEGYRTFSPPNWPLLNNKDNIPLPTMLDFSETSLQKVYSFEEVMAMQEGYRF